MLRVGTGCSGIGSPEQALKNLGVSHSLEFAIEKDKFARQTFLANFDPNIYPDDITQIDYDKLPDIDLFIAGFPCQAFSVAGNRAGFQDPRGTIFFNILELLKAKKPEVFILENVPGLLSHDQGKTFETIISLLSNEINGCPVMFPNPDSLGYNVHYTTLNTKDFGIPQNRERLFIIGFKNPVVYKFPDKNPSGLKLRDLLEENVPEKYFLSDEMVKSLLKNADSQKSKGNGFNISFADINQDFESKAILSNYAKMGTTQTYIKTKSLPQAQRINDINNESVTLSSQGGGMGAKTGLYAIPVLTPDKLIKRQNGRRFKENGDPSFTLTSQDRHGVYDGFRVRRLTPLECFRLQGFPDSFIKPCSDSQLYKQAGNSMTVQVMKALINSILDIKGKTND